MLHRTDACCMLHVAWQVAVCAVRQSRALSDQGDLECCVTGARTVACSLVVRARARGVCVRGTWGWRWLLYVAGSCTHHGVSRQDRRLRSGPCHGRQRPCVSRLCRLTGVCWWRKKTRHLGGWAPAIVCKGHCSSIRKQRRGVCVRRRRKSTHRNVIVNTPPRLWWQQRLPAVSSQQPGPH
jgi:hypothetical protein